MKTNTVTDNHGVQLIMAGICEIPTSIWGTYG